MITSCSSPSPLRCCVGLVLALTVPAPVIIGQSPPLVQCASATAVNGDVARGGEAEPAIVDAGSGGLEVTVFGSVVRTLPSPVAATGLEGLAASHHATWLFDLSLSAWDGSGGSIKGGNVPVPDLSLAVLDDPRAVQPRPGTVPQLYLWQTGAHVYQYGSPIDSGANPQDTAVFTPPIGVTAASATVTAPVVHFDRLSGAELWHFGTNVEVRREDGSVSRFAPVQPLGPQSGTLWHLTEVRDPYDNVATYSYDHLHRLERIDFPSGLQQHFDYAPSWAFGGLAHCLEVRYTQISGSYVHAMPERTWGLVFEGPLGPYGGHHFGSRLVRTYSAPRRVLVDQAQAGQPHVIGSNSTAFAQIVHTFAYDTMARQVTESQVVHVGTQFAATLVSGSGLPERAIERLTHGSGTDKRVVRQELLMYGACVDYSYSSSGCRTTDLADLPPGAMLSATIVHTYQTGGAVAESRRFEFYPPTGRIYSVTQTPSDDMFGRPRAHDPGNVGIGAGARGVEPERITRYFVFDPSCGCQKPSELRWIANRGGVDYTRTTRFEYDPVNKLLTARHELNQATGPAPQPAEVVWRYTHVRAKTAAQAWGAWLPDTEVTPDGTYTYHYRDWMPRVDAAQHGMIAGTVERRLAGVRMQGTLNQGGAGGTTAVSTTLHRNLPNAPGGLAFEGNVSGPLRVRGQPRRTVDEDGVATTMHYRPVGQGEGWLVEIEDLGGATRRAFARDAAGRTVGFTENVGSASLAAVVTHPEISADGVPYVVVSNSGGLLRRAEAYHDRFGNLTVSRHNNLGSRGSEPQAYSVSSNARDWIESQSIYHHRRLVERHVDRKPRHEAAASDQYLTTLLEYHPNGRLARSRLPNGSSVEFQLDGYWTQYQGILRDPSGSRSVASAREFVSPFLEVTARYENNGVDPLWTLVTRNAAGRITQVVEPGTTAPSGYIGSTGGAVHQYEVDVMGRIVEVRSYEGIGGSLLAQREMRYDQLGRLLWQHDLGLGAGTGSRHQAWRYRAGKARQLDSYEETGIAATTYTYDTVTGLLSATVDGYGNRVERSYHAQTPFLSRVVSTDIDPVSGVRVTETRHDVDPWGRIVRSIEGTPGAQHTYAYDSLGAMDRYVDPMGREHRFLRDGQDRIVEHLRVGFRGDVVRTWTTFEDGGQPDGRTRVHSYDGQGNVTVAHHDFADRLFIVQGPGGLVAPTSTSPNQPACLYSEFDEASRRCATYDGDGGRIEFRRDGMGRVIQRRLMVAGSRHTSFNTADEVRRDALGRIVGLESEGVAGGSAGAVTPIPVVDETLVTDSLGRRCEERFLFGAAPANALTIRSGYDPGAEFRRSLTTDDSLGGMAGLSQPLQLGYSPDPIGRLRSVDWVVAAIGTGSRSPLADFTWSGDLRRNRTVHLQAHGDPRIATEFAYDSESRLVAITDAVTTVAGGSPTPLSRIDFTYDAVGNLKREAYAKVDGSLGDRFAYDAYHRLSTAWLGVDAATLAADRDPGAFDPARMWARESYGFDAAQNRQQKTWQAVGMATANTTSYAVQGNTAPTGPSNRYASVTDAGGLAAPMLYDGRGNLAFDGRFVYRYDFVGRLQEVWRVTLADGSVPVARCAVPDATALEAAWTDVYDRVPDLGARLAREHMDATFRERLKARIRGGIVTTDDGVAREADLRLIALYGYDAFNRRVVQVVVGEATRFHAFDHWQEIVECELDGSGGTWKAAPVRQYVWGSRLDELLVFRRRTVAPGAFGWENYFVVHSAQDSATKLLDEQGNVVERYEYDSFGAVRSYTAGVATMMTRSRVGLPFLWKGMRLDTETGLLSMRHRHYSPDLGRFVSEDPMGGWFDPLNWGNGLAYCGNEPVGCRDPFGLTGEGKKPPDPASKGPAKSAERGDLSGEKLHTLDPHPVRGAYVEITIVKDGKSHTFERWVRMKDFVAWLNSLDGWQVSSLSISAHHSQGTNSVFTDRGDSVSDADLAAAINLCEGAEVDLNVCNGGGLAEKIRDNNKDVGHKTEYTDGENRHHPTYGDWTSTGDGVDKTLENPSPSSGGKSTGGKGDGSTGGSGGSPPSKGSNGGKK